MYPISEWGMPHLQRRVSLPYMPQVSWLVLHSKLYLLRDDNPHGLVLSQHRLQSLEHWHFFRQYSKSDKAWLRQVSCMHSEFWDLFSCSILHSEAGYTDSQVIQSQKSTFNCQIKPNCITIQERMAVPTRIPHPCKVIVIVLAHLSREPVTMLSLNEAEHTLYRRSWFSFVPSLSTANTG